MSTKPIKVRNENRLGWPGALGWCALFLICLFFSVGVVFGQATPTEHQLKAAVLGNVAKFVEWPARTNEEAITIGVFGHDPFEGDLEVVLKNVKVKGKGIKTRRANDINELKDCHIIFFSARETVRASEAIRKLGERPVLTVGEDDRFLSAGGGITLETEQRKIQISISLEAAESAGLKLNPQLLSLAKKVVKRKGDR